MIGLSTSGSISLGCALVAGRNRVPRPAAGKTAFRIRSSTASMLHSCVASHLEMRHRPESEPGRSIPHCRQDSDRGLTRYRYRIDSMLDAAFVRDHLDEVRSGLRNRGLEPDAELEQLATLETRRRRLIPGGRGPEARAERRGRRGGSCEAAGPGRVGRSSQQTRHGRSRSGSSKSSSTRSSSSAARC